MWYGQCLYFYHMSQEFENSSQYKETFKDLPTLDLPWSKKISCTDCGEEVSVKNIDLKDKIGKCENCNTVFSFQNEKLAKPRRQEIFQPEGIEVYDYPDSMDILFKWRKVSKPHWFIVFFTILWNLILFPFVIGIVSTGSYWGLLPLGFHLLAGAGLGIYVLRKFLNSTSISANADLLSIISGPINLPWSKDKHIQSDDINQIYVKRYSNTKVNGRPIYHFDVRAVTVNDGDISLVKGINNVRKAQYIEQELEMYLGIKDRSMVNEEPMP